ncbi:CHAT domain-containing tetratricopeptide repeat protein [Marivirga arenosa]|uniref:CHAT domain-containing tetratricopeptide repeat protein n=1 Tax=Marivirga arenosa TaxID=3059076 RepID=A0AA51ZVG2_9BACT|nr:CHAT domain-containing tetratricopeptide repeat protein [Marivirga sp. BKB1-2]WNB17487.1 CHAT domain-containing tetratricopeptide repeat protein [Marivirga sp. BKB1-2]
MFFRLIKLTFSTFIVFVFCFSFSASAQFGIGNALKKRAEELVKDKLKEKTEEKRDSYDTLSFNYAIAFLDKTESFENQQKGERLVKTANFMLRDGDPQTELEAARDIYDFGRLNYNNGNDFMAEANLKIAKLKYEQLSATSEPNYLKSIGLLGLLYDDMGRYNKAEEFTLTALDGWEEIQGKESVGYLAELNNYAVLLMNLGNYLEAESIIQKLGGKLKTDLENEKLPYAIFLNNHAILNQYMGRKDKALDLMEQCVEIAKESLTDKNSTYLQFLTNKAILEQENGDLESAENTFQNVLDLQESRFKLNAKNDPDYAHMKSNIAALYVEKGELDKAEEALILALEIYKDELGAEHLTTAGTQADLGNLYRYLGELDKAEPLLQSALYTRERNLSKTHPKVIKSQEDMALWFWAKGQIKQANNYFGKVMDTSLEFVKDYFPALSEAEKTKYWEQLKPRFFRYYNYALENYYEYPELLDNLIKYRLATKGILLTASTALRNSIYNQNDPELEKLYEQWLDQKQQLTNAYTLSDEEIDEQSINIDSLQNVANQTEKELSLKSDAFSTVYKDRNTDYKTILERLENGQVLVEVIQYPIFDKKLTSNNAYAYIIFKKDERPEILVNEDGDLLENRYYAYYNNVINQKMEDQYSFAQYWELVNKETSDANRIYISPDGIYNQINMNTLKQNNGRYLIQDYDIRYIGHPNDILVEKSTGKTKSTAFLMGDPDFNSASIAQLPGTRQEIENISKYLSNQMKMEKYLNKEANESNLKKVKSPKYLHLASHGYFLQDEKASNNLFGVQLQYIRQNPLLRSGLILSGIGNDENSEASQSFNQSDNGFFSAYEAINLNLNNTEMVVLSACETGKGDVKAGEGVYGLQRAFIVAGAQSLVMSLWKVDDAATQKLMSSFYKENVNGKAIPDAFRTAQLAMLNEYKHPYYWGAFIMFSK